MHTFKFLFLILIASHGDGFGKSSKKTGELKKVSESWQNKISGGIRAKKGDLPYVAAIIRDNSFRCTASIIDKKWILTAAHCLNNENREEVSLFTVAVGDVIVSKNSFVYLVENFYIHPQYNNSFLDIPIGKPKDIPGLKEEHIEFDQKQVVLNDIGLVKLKKKLTWSSSVSPIRLGSIHEDYPVDVVVVGYGMEYHNDERHSRNLNRFTLTSVIFKKCAQKYHWLVLMEQKTQICAFKGKHEAAYRRDFGGPLVDPDTGRQVGIASFTIGEGYPAVFTRTSHFVPWIKNVTGSRRWFKGGIQEEGPLFVKLA